MEPRQINAFHDKIWNHYRDHARDLPWRHDPTPYQVFISEVMLQQTQVARVMAKYPEWLERFPDFETLAQAKTSEVISAWQGMGYNRRALWLHRAAQAVMDKFDGRLPGDPAVLRELPGIGPNTACSIAAFAYDAPVVFIETNIRRVFIHEFFEESATVSDKQLLPLIEAALDRQNPRKWYYALMDYGAWLAKQVPNPNRRSRHYAVQSKFEGSLRQIRGEVLRQLTSGGKTAAELDIADERLGSVLETLRREGFIQIKNDTWSLSG